MKVLEILTEGLTKGQAIKILGLKNNFSKEELKAAYRRRSREFHPDRGGDTEKMSLVNQAYDLLKKMPSSNWRAFDFSDFGKEATKEKPKEKPKEKHKADPRAETKKEKPKTEPKKEKPKSEPKKNDFDARKEREKFKKDTFKTFNSEWEKNRLKYRDAIKHFSEMVVHYFNPNKFAAYFAQQRKVPFDFNYKIKGNATIEDGSRNHRVIEIVFYSKDKTVAFDLFVDIVIGANAYTSIGKLDFDSLRKLHIMAHAYNKKGKTEITNRIWDASNNLSVFEKPELIFPANKIK